MVGSAMRCLPFLWAPLLWAHFWIGLLRGASRKWTLFREERLKTRRFADLASRFWHLRAVDTEDGRSRRLVLAGPCHFQIIARPLAGRLQFVDVDGAQRRLPSFPMRTRYAKNG